MKQLSDMLTQTATVEARSQGFDAYGAETLGTLTETYVRIDCLAIPMTPEQASWHGLAITDRPALLFFEHGLNITQDSTGQPYQQVKVTIGDAVYYATSHQVSFGDNIGADDLQHVQVTAVQRQVDID